MWADCHHARSRAPTAPQPHTVAPPGAEASADIKRASTKEHLRAELVVVAAARLTEKALERCPAV
eukprot:9285673-Alexandrium_andersonii.AAC.1